MSDSLKTGILAVVVTAVLLTGAFIFTSMSTSKDTATATTPTRERNFGSLAGPNIPSQYLTWGDVSTYNYTDTFNQASTTVCSITSPAATSTLVFASAAVTTGTTTALVYDFGKSNVMDATTTLIGQTSTVASGALATLVASTTQTMSALVFGPSQILNVKYGGALGALNVLVGTCKAQFIVN